MTTIKQAIGEHDFVALLEGVGKWPACTTGTVVSDYGRVKLVEISDEQGVALDFIQVPETLLRLITRHAGG